MSITQTCTGRRAAERTQQARSITPAVLVARLTGLLKRRRQIRESEAFLGSLNDRLLADIGLRRIGAGTIADIRTGIFRL